MASNNIIRALRSHLSILRLSITPDSRVIIQLSEEIKRILIDKNAEFRLIMKTGLLLFGNKLYLFKRQDILVLLVYLLHHI